MLTLGEALKRKKVFDESGRWQTAELVLLGQEAYINRWNFKPNYYLVVECAEVDYEEEVFHLIITLDPSEPTKNTNSLSLKLCRLGFTNWWVDTEDLQQMRKSLKPLVPILYTKEDNDELFRS